MRFLPLLPLLMLLALPAMASEPTYRVIAYHDVKDEVAGDYDPDQYAVSTNNLIAQFTWLRGNGFQPVSVDQIIDAREGRRPLPENAVLLTFDDGLISFYTRVFPLLKVFNYPAVISVVTSWIETDSTVTYADENRSGDGFVNWKQVQELQASGLVEIASHSHDLHKGVHGNSQNNLLPAAVTRIYDGETYENESDYLDRIDADLEKSVETILSNTGRSPRVIAWPYGAFNDAAAAVAAKHGMSINLTLAEESTVRSDVLYLGRYLAVANPDLGDFSSALLLPPRDQIVRVAQVDLDYVYDPDPVQQTANLSRLLDRINALEISHVFLQAFSDADADGGADAVYFPNRHIPVRADLFNRVSWQLKTRADVRVFAWLPMLSFVGGPFKSDWRVVESRGGLNVTDPDSEPRLSPFNMEAREKIAEIYEDLATYARFDGLLFHDDGRLNEREDFSEVALDYYHRELGEGISVQKLAADSELMRRWTRLKSRTIVEFSMELVERVRHLQPGIKSARNIFAGALLDSEGPEYLAQNFDEFLRAYDYVALMAMPALEGVTDHDGFYVELVDAVRNRPSGLERTIFELQTVDWSQPRPIPSTDLRATMRRLQSLGVRHLGYYPDDFIAGHPDLQQLRLGMSLAEEFGSAAP